MFRNYWIVAVRNLYKSKGFSAINIVGLSLGLACSLLIVLWVQDEKSMDAFHANGSRLYRVYQRQYLDGKVVGQYYTQGLLGRELKREIPGIEMANTYQDPYVHTLSAGEKNLKKSGAEADSDFFRMFSYPLLAGSPASVLSDPNSIVLSRSTAMNFFGSPQAAMGKTIRYDNRIDFKVAGVFEDVPTHSPEQFDYLLNWNFWLKDNPYLLEWDNMDPYTDILLRPGVRAADVEKAIVHFTDRYMTAGDKGFRIEYGLQPYPDLYLHNHFTDGRLDGGRIEYVDLFSLVGLFILVIACINFMNLTTARSMKRAREIGVRKVLGAGRSVLVRQFLGEAVLISFLSAAAAVLVVALVLPTFNHLTGKQMAFPVAHWIFWAELAGLALGTGVLSGSYPALSLSAFRPVQVLKGGTQRVGPKAQGFRKGLVVFQFVLSIVLIVSTVLISRQVRYIEDANLGFDRENLVYVPVEGDLEAKRMLFMQKALQLPGVTSITTTSQAPTNIGSGTIDVDWPGKDPTAKPMFAWLQVGYDFTKTLQIRMLQGRDFSRDFPTDSTAYVLNQAAVDKIGYKDPLGKPLSYWGVSGKIIGVADNFHYQSLRENIRPLVMCLVRGGNSNYFLVRTAAGQAREALAGLEGVCKELNPRFPFTFQFASEEYDKLYQSEELVGKLSVVFAFLAIVISCLGLLGLSIFSAEQRTKEVSIRKVLGASVASLCRLLCSEFVVLVGIAFCIATPLAYWGMHDWLRHFAYRTDLSWWIFGASGLIALLIALGTVSYQAIRTALANPAKTLRNE